ncbi:MAG: hypothetical protein HQK84_11235 [Nitrospinae bacterium]|nr:hypothetical protein [Nitrospinota bacterium]
MKNEKSELNNLPLILLTLPAFLYFTGFVYYDSFLNYWGLDETLFPLSFHKILIHAFFPKFNASTYYLLPLLLFTEALFIFLLIKTSSSENRLFKMFSNVFMRRIDGKIDTQDKVEHNHKVIAICKYFFYLFLFFIAFHLISYTCNYFGEKSAYLLHESFLKGEQEVMVIENQNKGRLKGNLVLCSETHCAFYISKKVSVIPLSDVKEIVAKPLL